MTLLGQGFLLPGQHRDVAVQLTANVTYRIRVTAADPTVDFDLAVFDENANPVSVDASLNADAHCQVTPVWTGPFFVRVACARGSGNYALHSEP